MSARRVYEIVRKHVTEEQMDAIVADLLDLTTNKGGNGNAKEIIDLDGSMRLLGKSPLKKATKA